MGGFAMSNANNPSGVPIWAFWLFQAAVSRRHYRSWRDGRANEFGAYRVHSRHRAVVYPIIGHWVGRGWLGDGIRRLRRIDRGSPQAGSRRSLVRCFGSRLASSTETEWPAIAGHSIPLASTGVHPVVRMVRIQLCTSLRFAMVSLSLLSPPTRIWRRRAISAMLTVDAVRKARPVNDHERRWRPVAITAHVRRSMGCDR